VDAHRRAISAFETPSVAHNNALAWRTSRAGAVCERASRSSSARCPVTQRVRKRVEEIFGWVKTVGGGRKLRYIGRERNHQWAVFTAAAYNLVRLQEGRERGRWAGGGGSRHPGCVQPFVWLAEIPHFR
jgi:DDE family transposase